MKTWLSGLMIVAAMATIALVGLSGCEETLSGADVELPYREELVVQGFLTADGPSDTILITRTLPPLEKWTIARAAVTDAVASIRSEGVDYPLVHVSLGRYRIDGLKPTPGKTYQLSVHWKNLNVNATATVPPAPQIIGFSLDTVKGGCDLYYPSSGSGPAVADEIRVILEYVRHGGNINSSRLGVSYSYNGQYVYSEDGYNYFFYEIDSSGSTNKAVLNRRCYSSSDPYNVTIDTLFLNFVEYEEAFTSYYQTRWNGNDDDAFFGPSGEHPDWNVKGDGFGWFFGRSTAIDTAVFR